MTETDKKSVDNFVSDLRSMGILLLISIFLILIKSICYDNGFLDFNFLSTCLKILTAGIVLILSFLTYKLIFFLIKNRKIAQHHDNIFDMVMFFLSFSMMIYLNYQLGNIKSAYNLPLFFIAIIGISFGIRSGITSLLVYTMAVFGITMYKIPANANTCIEINFMIVIILILTSWLMSKFIIFHDKEILHKTRLETITDLAGKVAHEIRNPLVPIKGYIQLEKGKKHSTIDKNTINLLLCEIGKIEDIITEFLMLGNNQPLELVRINLATLLEKTNRSFTSGKTTERKTLDFVINNPVPVIKGDWRLLKRAFQRIYRCAYQNTLEGNGLKVELSKKNVDGISMIKIEYKVNFKYEPDYNVGDLDIGTNLLKRDDLELALAERIIEKHNGKMSMIFDNNYLHKLIIYLPENQG
ncbi:MAG TPA: hypothetical protein GX526_00760 [Thermoanaerobacterales bacterium]|nr:hypothetical protein [Thermoanaerobacterales bacterium]